MFFNPKERKEIFDPPPKKKGTGTRNGHEHVRSHDTITCVCLY